MLKTYLSLTKPGIIMGNALPALGGFFLASLGFVDWWTGLAMITGLSLVIASACVFNNYMDRGIDQKMERTKNRALVQGAISGRQALLFGILLGLIGVKILFFFTNVLALGVALVGFVFYVFFYGWAKRRSVYGTHVGAVAGAIPPVVGYVAAAGVIDAGAILLFLILCFWQMPHFFAIAIRRRDEYAAAGIPVWPVKKSIKSTKIQMLLYIVLFTIAADALTFFHYTGYMYLSVMTALGVIWLGLALKGFKTIDDTATKLWARKLFLFSLVIILIFSALISVDAFLF